MDKNIRNFIKVGLIHFMAYPNTIKGEGPIEETMKRILEDDYFDAVEITWIKDDAVRKSVKDMIEVASVDVYYGGQPRLLTTGNNPNAVDEAERQIALANLKEGIDEAAEIGAKSIRIPFG